MLSFPLVGPVARLAHLLGAVTDDGVSIKGVPGRPLWTLSPLREHLDVMS